MKKITEASAQKAFTLFLRFDDGTSGVVDLSDLAGRGVFASWENQGAFENVHVTETGAVEWPGNIDLCSDALYMRLTGKTAEEIFPKLHHQASYA